MIALRRPAVVAASQLTPAAPTVVSGKVADLAAKRAIGRAAKSVLMLSTSNTQPGVNESDARTTTAEAVVAAARTQLSAAELDGLMAEGGWLDPVMTRLRTALKASGWIVMMATAAKISPTLVEVLRRTPCPAAAPREHTVQAIARLLVSNGLARAQAHVWPLTAQRILGLIHEYQRLLKAPEEQLARRGLTKLELQLELVCNIHNASHSQDVSRTALSKAVRIACHTAGQPSFNS
eukprot:XP_001696433.1 predicted protein [Chlamydomonas reinhardtii]